MLICGRRTGMGGDSVCRICEEPNGSADRRTGRFAGRRVSPITYRSTRSAFRYCLLIMRWAVAMPLTWGKGWWMDQESI